MSKTAAHQSTPLDFKGEKRTSNAGQKSAKAVFAVAALNMAWQLAIVVLVPVVGGFELDKHLGLTPTLTILGFIIAMAGTSVVLWRQLQRVAPTITQADIDNAKKLREKEDDE
jgi:F0F1-type ATP synthase assembly protein I